jgi:hypothetical protein
MHNRSIIIDGPFAERERGRYSLLSGLTYYATTFVRAPDANRRGGRNKREEARRTKRGGDRKVSEEVWRECVLTIAEVSCAKRRE